MTDAKTEKGGNIVDTERYKYQRTATQVGDKVVHSKDNGDAVAIALRGKDSDGLLNVLDENGMKDDRYVGYHRDMSTGRFRMTAGQAIRYRWKRGQPTRIDGVVLPVPEGVKPRGEDGKLIEQIHSPD